MTSYFNWWMLPEAERAEGLGRHLGAPVSHGGGHLARLYKHERRVES